MQGRIITDTHGNILIQMEGNLDYENGPNLKKEITELVATNPCRNITLDMNHVDFVGSSGIGLFVDMIRSLNTRKDQIRLMNVKSEFMKVFKLYNFDAMELLYREFDCDDTESLGPLFANRKVTFEN